MKCSCLKDQSFNFSLKYAEDHLIFIDESIWVTKEGNEELDEYDLIITSEYSSLILKAKVKGETKILYSKLPGSKECDYDGIYTFTISEICDQTISITKAVLENMYCAYSKMITAEDPDWDNIAKVFRDINIIEAHAMMSDRTKALEHYNILKRFLKKINCSCK